ncbi:MAG TPA: hypothetical protein VFH59_13285 [Frateuria sp.]|uniref:hypothetical protein n=1 Tax=Frateuria sp. TaxID=2211372 RepID=UPI002D80C2CB|nr:hypothetical protein [Frateuria sp.]HET6806404.1 hypothetical protein [Frateuria sp.]
MSPLRRLISRNEAIIEQKFGIPDKVERNDVQAFLLWPGCAGDAALELRIHRESEASAFSFACRDCRRTQTALGLEPDKDKDEGKTRWHQS